MNYRVWGILVVAAILSSNAEAKFSAKSEAIPVTRLITNINAYVAEKPDDAHGYYLLGRIHALAFMKMTGELNALMPGAQEAQLPQLSESQKKAKRKKRISLEARRQHLAASIINYQIAAKMEPKFALYKLGLAYILDEGASFAKHIGLPPLRPTPSSTLKSSALKRYWRKRASSYYLSAHELAILGDLSQKIQPIGGLKKMISYEAGRGYVRMIRLLRTENENSRTLTRVNSRLRELEVMPRGAVTPIIFPGAGQPLVTSYRDLLGEGSVYFDLDSDGEVERWPWLAPTTCILVWGQTKTRVESGRQLFGTTTFGMFWRNGYEPLDALDDNRDGWLTGGELLGLSIWTDSNADGISTESELMPIQERGIIGIATYSTGRDDKVEQNAAGIILEDGSSLPTFDWVTSPLPDRVASR